MSSFLLLTSFIACTLGNYPDDLTEIHNRLDDLEKENASQAETITTMESQLEVLSPGVDLAELADTVAQNTEEIATNAVGVATNTADIAANADDIAANTTSISDLATAHGTPESIIYGNYYIDSTFDIAQIDGVQEVTGNLIIANATGMTSLEGLESLSAVRSIMQVHSIETLDSLDGLESLTAVTGFYVHSNSSLTSIEGLEVLTEVVFLHIYNNSILCQSVVDELVVTLGLSGAVAYGNDDSC
jgi:hypothetical protein